jgi:1-deoxy-D-xylulose-5-phosphate synthase
VFCNIYSTFLQRAYDQIIHDVALQNLPVIFCLDRAGLVGEDGATHHGIFDIAYLRCIPNLLIYAPLNEKALRNIMFTAQLGLNHPIAIRYPRGRGITVGWQNPFEKIEIGKAECLKSGSRIAVLSTGTIGHNVTEAIHQLSNPEEVAHFNFGFIKPLDTNLLHAIMTDYMKIITVEEGVIKGGFGGAVVEFAAENNYQTPIKILGIPDQFIEHGSILELQEICGIDVKSLIDAIKD